jgi:hypothetical protein
MENIYSTPEWLDLAARAKARDGHRCTVGRILGGECRGDLHVHHIVPVEEGGPAIPDLGGVLTTCAGHHRALHSLRMFVARRTRPKIRPCRHQHRYDIARRECRRMRLREAGIESDGRPEDERRLLAA